MQGEQAERDMGVAHDPHVLASNWSPSMSRLLLKLAIAATGSLVSSNPTVAQVLPPAQKAAHVEITQGPALELARDDLAIIRWTTNNPGGSDDHFAVIYYGTDPEHLSQMAKSHIRLNRGHSETVFRVLVGGLQPRTTYYYTVTSTESNGKSDGVESPVSQFTTPGPGERIVP
jgi:phosphodiesterase/alkaline phosphatase D-like protein